MTFGLSITTKCSPKFYLHELERSNSFEAQCISTWVTLWTSSWADCWDLSLVTGLEARGVVEVGTEENQYCLAWICFRETITVSLDNVEPIPSDRVGKVHITRVEMLLPLSRRWPMPLEGGKTSSSGREDWLEFRSSVSLVFPHAPIPTCRIPFFPNQCPHFNSRLPVNLSGQLVLEFNQL